MTLWRSLTGLSTIVIVLVGSFLLSSTQPAIAQPTTSPTASPAIAQPANTPKTCKVGVYLIGLYGFDFGNSLFTSDFWLWSNCRSQDLEPLKVVDFVNASTKDIETSLDATYKREKGYWSYVKVSGAFRHNWDVKNFPFDRHVLQIILENTNAGASDFIYTADTKGSKFRKNIPLDGWRITDFSVAQKPFEYETTFGDPDLPDTGTSQYSRLYVQISIEHDSRISFFKICSPVYIAFAISLLAYFLDVATGTGLLAGTLFAVVVNQQVSESILGGVEGLTLIDQIHITAMAYILATAVVIVRSYIQVGAAQEQLAIHGNRRSLHITWISYVVVNIIIIVAAAIAG